MNPLEGGDGGVGVAYAEVHFPLRMRIEIRRGCRGGGGVLEGDQRSTTRAFAAAGYYFADEDGAGMLGSRFLTASKVRPAAAAPVDAPTPLMVRITI